MASMAPIDEKALSIYKREFRATFLGGLGRGWGGVLQNGGGEHLTSKNLSLSSMLHQKWLQPTHRST